MILIYLTKLRFSMCRHMPRTPGIENGAPKHCVTRELKKKTENIHVFSHRFRANNVSGLSFYCCFTYCVSYRHLRIIDYVNSNVYRTSRAGYATTICLSFQLIVRPLQVTILKQLWSVHNAGIQSIVSGWSPVIIMISDIVTVWHPMYWKKTIFT